MSDGARISHGAQISHGPGSLIGRDDDLEYITAFADRAAVFETFEEYRPEVVYHAAARCCIAAFR